MPYNDTDRAHQAVNAIEQTAAEYAAATQDAAALEDGRAEARAAAVRRIMERDGIAATPADKLAHTDAEYAAHCERCRDAAAAVIQARAVYEAALRRADLAVSLATAA